MTTLSNQEIIQKAPSFGTTFPHQSLSQRYQMYSTMSIIDKLRENGWLPTQARQSRVRDEQYQGFQKHIIRLRHQEMVVGAEFIEALIVNSHNGKSAYRIMLGVFRCICTNGLVVGGNTAFDTIRIPHRRFSPEEVVEATYCVLEMGQKILENVGQMKLIQLAETERVAFAKSALQIAYEHPEKAPITADQILQPRRQEDFAVDLWSTLNVAQENLLKGGLIGRSSATGRLIRTRGIKSIERDVMLNQKLWELAESLKRHKEAK